MAGLLELAAEVLGRPVAIEHHPRQAGDVDRTGGATARADALLGWKPEVGIVEGLARQAAWHEGRSR